MRKTRIFTPGPTPLMPEAQLAMARPIIHHRTAEFKNLLLEARQNLQKIFRTKNEVVILAASGTGAMEAAVCNLLSPDDQALAVVAGKFGERWVEICQSYRIPCATLEKESGTAASAEEICRFLKKYDARTLLIQGCETSTATSHDLRSISCWVRQDFPEVLIVVDAITTLGTEPVETDEWGLDVVISGSQKSFSIPPGLSFLSLSERAIERMRQNHSSPRYYFDLLRELEVQRNGETAFTPAVSLVAALNETAQQILRQGLTEVLTEADMMARCARQGLLALGFKLLSKSPSRGATAAFPPDGILAPELVKRLERRFGMKVAGGQGELRGKIIRIAHLGYFDLPDVFCLLSAIELCLLEMKAPIDVGSGVRAAILEAAKTDR